MCAAASNDTRIVFWCSIIRPKSRSSSKNNERESEILEKVKIHFLSPCNKLAWPNWAAERERKRCDAKHWNRNTLNFPYHNWISWITHSESRSKSKAQFCVNFKSTHQSLFLFTLCSIYLLWEGQDWVRWGSEISMSSLFVDVCSFNGNENLWFN